MGDTGNIVMIHRDSLPASSLVFSILVHLLLFIGLKSTVNQTTPPATSEALKVELVSPPPAQTPPPAPQKEKKQFVSTPDSPTTPEPPPNTQRLAEKDSVTQKETIKRGVEKPSSSPPAPPPEKRPPAQKPAAVKEKAPPAAAAPEPLLAKGAQQKLNLKLDNDTTLARFGMNIGKKSDSDSNSAKANNQERSRNSAPRAFSRPPGSGAAFMGNTGVPDFLPNLPDGDLTMLNTKANQYAVFVRRVALRVFQGLRRVGWESMTARDIIKIGQEVSVEAVLDIKGNLIEVRILSTSGSNTFDNVVERAVKEGAGDPNPPKEAALADGTIRFFFNSKSWVRGGVNQRTGAPREERWIFLGTGLR